MRPLVDERLGVGRSLINDLSKCAKLKGQAGKDCLAAMGRRDYGGPLDPITDVVETVVETTGNIVTAPVDAVVAATRSIPVLGDVTRIVGAAASAPLHLASSIASGARIDRAVVGHLKSQLKTLKEAAPYAQMVVSVVPGVGTGVAAAIGAGAALAEGKSIDEIAKAAIRSALPGGPVAAAAYDTALRVAGGANVTQATLEGTRAALPESARQAFDVGLAVVTGENIQNALASGLANLAASQVQQISVEGAKALAGSADLRTVLQGVPTDDARKGVAFAAGLLSQSGVNQKALAAVRNKLPAAQRQGFDSLLRSQAGDIAWLADVVDPPARRPPALRPAPVPVSRPPALVPATPPRRPPALAPVAPPTAPTAAAAPRVPPALTAPGGPAQRRYGPYPQVRG